MKLIICFITLKPWKETPKETFEIVHIYCIHIVQIQNKFHSMEIKNKQLIRIKMQL